jgi:hypothetical protein
MQDLGSTFRFLNVIIPAGSHIVSAKLTLRSVGILSNVTVNTRIRAEAADNPATFSTSANFDARTWTTAHVHWNDIAAWSSLADYDSPDFAAVLQEVISRPGWASGNAVAILWDDFEKLSTANNNTIRECIDYVSDPTLAPKLVVTFTLPPSAPTGLTATQNQHDKVTLAWNASTDAVDYGIAIDGVFQGWLGNVLTTDDTASPPVISYVSEDVSRNRYFKSVRSRVLGPSIANGTSYSYTVKCRNVYGQESGYSSAATGFRLGFDSYTYQWKRSAADSDAAYSDISGAIESEHYDYDAPVYPAGRYYECAISSPGAVDVTTTAARGYLRDPSLVAVAPKLDIVVKNSSGDVLTYLTVSSPSTDDVVNQLPQLEFTVPYDEDVMDYLDDPLNELWLYIDGDLVDIYRIATKDEDA